MILIVVAHPDDESFWFGGTILILKNLGFKITIVCLTLSNDNKRSTEFKNACKKMHVDGFIMDYSDKLDEGFLELNRELELVLNNHQIRVNDLEYVITHSPNGNERSHPQHIKCFKLISEWTHKNKINLGFFSEKLFSELRSYELEDNTGKIGFYRTVFNHEVILRNLIKIVIENIFSIKNLLYNLLKQIRLYITLNKYHYFVSIKTNLEQKQALLQLYSSQIKGLKEYKTYFNNYEYLYLERDNFWKKLKKRYAIYIKKTAS